jgi:transposase-like protein
VARAPLEKDYPYLYLDATYLKVRWGRERDEPGSAGGRRSKRGWL